METVSVLWSLIPALMLELERLCGYNNKTVDRTMRLASPNARTEGSVK